MQIKFSVEYIYDHTRPIYLANLQSTREIVPCWKEKKVKLTFYQAVCWPLRHFHNLWQVVPLKLRRSTQTIQRSGNRNWKHMVSWISRQLNETRPEHNLKCTERNSIRTTFLLSARTADWRDITIYERNWVKTWSHSSRKEIGPENKEGTGYETKCILVYLTYNRLAMRTWEGRLVE